MKKFIRHPITGFWSFAIPETSKYPEEAMKLILAVTTVPELQLLMGEAVCRRMARIVDQRHVRGEDMHMGVDLETGGHGNSQLGESPAFLTTAAHISTSDFSRASSCSGEQVAGSPPRSIIRFWKSGSAITARTWPLR